LKLYGGGRLDRPFQGIGWLVGAFALGQADLLSGSRRFSGLADLAFPFRTP
jgi:hypothetical protein